MKILFSIEDSPISQDCYAEEKNNLLSWTFDIGKLDELQTILDNSLLMNLHEDDYFNLRLWIEVLNRFDATLSALLKWFFRANEKSICVDDWHKNDNNGTTDIDLYNKVHAVILQILTWTRNLLSHSFNKSTYNSVELVVQILKQTSHDDLALCSLEVLSALSTPPLNHRNVFTYSHTTVLHKNTDYTLPLFDILLAGNNLGTFTASNIANGLVPESTVDGETQAGPVPRSKWWFTRMGLCLQQRSSAAASGAGISSNTNTISDSLHDPWTWYRSYLQAFQVVVRTHRDMVDVSNFFNHKPQLQHDLLYILRSNAIHWTDEAADASSGFIPTDIRVLATQCVSALLERSENHFTNAQKEGEYSGAVRLIGPFDRILQGQLGIDGVQIQGLVPSLLRQELQWLSTLSCSSDEEGPTNCDRLLHLEHLLLLVMTSLPLPRSMQSYMNNGVVDSILAVVKRHDLSDLHTLNALTAAEKTAQTAVAYEFHWQMFCVSSLLVQVLDMIISAKKGAMESFYTLGGPTLVLERLKHESAQVGPDIIDSYVQQQGSKHFVAIRNSSIPLCCQSLHLSLTAMLDSLLNNSNNRELRAGSHSSLNQMDLIRSPLFTETVVSVCEGIASVCAAILATVVRMLCELINNDNATPAVINLFLLQGPVIRKAYAAVSSPHIRHDIDTMNSVLNLMTGLCIKEEGLRLIHANNPFKILLGIFHDVHYLLSESLLLHPSFVLQIGSQCGDLLRSNPQLSGLFADTILGEMKAVLRIVEEFNARHNASREGGTGKTISDSDAGKDDTYTEVIVGNMMIAILMCFDNVVERSKEFAKDFVAKDGLDCLYGFLTHLFGSRRHLLINLSSKIGVTNEDKPGNNQVRRILLHSYTKLLSHQTQEVMLDISKRIQHETEQLSMALAAFHLIHPSDTAEEVVEAAEVAVDEDEDEEDSEAHKSAVASSSSKRGKGDKKPRVVKKKIGNVKNLRAKFAQEKSSKADKEIAAASEEGQMATSKKSSKDFYLHRILGTVTDSTADLLAFDYTGSHELFAVLYSLLRLEALYILFSDVNEFANSVANYHAHKYLPLFIPTIVGASMVNVNCVSEIARAHEVIVSNYLSRAGTSSSSVGVSFDVYILPGKHKIKVRDNFTDSEAGRNRSAVRGNSSQIDTNHFVHASERICSEDSKSLTFFKLEESAFIRKREIDGVPNMEVVGLRPSTLPSSSAGFRRDQSISMYRLGKNVLRSVCNAFNDMVGVVLQSFKLEHDAAVFRSHMDKMRPALLDQCIRKVLQWGYDPQSRWREEGRLTASLLEEQHVFSVQKHLQFKYCIDTCTTFLGLRGFPDHSSNSAAVTMAGNPLAFASMYSHDNGELFELVIKACCDTILGCFVPTTPSSSENTTQSTVMDVEGSSSSEADLQVQQRICCIALASKLILFLKNVLHCLAFQDTAWGKEIHNRHGYPKPVFVKYNCFIKLYTHLRTVWSHDQLYSLPSHMCLAVVELMTQFEECGIKTFIACGQHDSSDLPSQFKYLEELRNSVREDSCRMLLHLVQFGGLHYEEKHASFRHAQSADVSIAPAHWPLNVLAAENKMKRVDFLRQLMELYVKGQTTQISLENKFYRCETTLENEMRSVEKGICIGAEKQYKVMSGVLAMLFCRLATLLHDHSQSAGGAIDFLALEGVLTATNSALYATGNLHAHSCSPFQNAIMLLLTTIPEFLSVFSDIAQLIGKVTGDINDQPLCVHAVHHRWLLPAYLFLDTALQPFLTNAPLISYCDLFGRYLAKGVQLFSSVYFQYDCGALFCNSADDGVISALLLTTPVQHFYAGDRKKSASLAEVVAAAEDAATINAEFQTPMAQLRSEAGDGLVQSCLAVVGAITKDRAQASEFTPLLLQATLQVLSHLARETSAAQLILQPKNLATVLEVGVGFERLPLYLTAIVQASVEQQSEEALRNKMRDCVMLAAEAFQEQGGAATSSDQKMKAKLGKAMGKFVSIVEPLMMRNPGVFLTVITDPALLSVAHNPVDYLPSYLQPGCAAQMNTWQPLLSSVGQLFMQRITALFVQSRSSSEGVASSEADDLKGLLGDVLVSLADLLHSLAPPQGHYLLSQLVVSGEATQPLMYFLLNELLPVFSVTERDGAAVASTLEWHKKKRFNVKSSPSDLARAKAYSSGVYLLLSVAAIQGSTRQQVLSEVSSRLTIAVQTISETGRCDERGVVTLLDFVNAVDVPPYSSRLSGVTFCVPTDGILSALSVLGVHSSLIALQDRVNASGSSSLLSPSLASAINLMMMRGVTAANELSRFVAACKEQMASDEVLSSNSSSSSSSSVYNTQFWSDNLYLFTNIHTVARRWAKQTDKQNKKLPASVISADNRSMVVSTANGTEVRLLFDGVGGNDWQRDGSVSGSSRVEEDAPASESHSVSGAQGVFSPARDDLGEDAEGEDEDDGSDDDDDGFEDVDDDGEGYSDEDDGFGGGFDEDDEHRDFIDDEDEEEGHMAGHGFPLGMHVDFGGMGMHMGGGPGNGPFWQHIDMNNAMDHMDDLDGSDMSLNSEDDEDGGGDDDLDEFDMMSAPPDSDDDEDSELNDAGSIGDDNTVDNSMIYVDESDGGDAQHQNSEYNGLPHEMKMDNDIYHMVGYLYYSEGFEQRSLFADILAPLLGEIKETHFGRSDFQTLASAAHQARVSLHLPCLSRRSWNAEKDYTNGLLNCNVMTPFVTYLLLKAEFAAECAEEAIRDGTFFAALEHVLKALTAIAEKSVAPNAVLAYNFRSANRLVTSVRGVSELVGEDFKTGVASLEGGVSVELPAMGSLISTAFVSNIAQYSAQLVTVNFNRLLNLKSMSLYKLCLASNQVVRNYQMSLIFMYSSPERTSEWDRALLTQLVHLLDVPALDSNVMLLVFEVLCYQCDEMYRCTEKIVLGLRNAMLSPPIKTAVQDPEGPSSVGVDAMETAVEDEAVPSGGEVAESVSLSVMALMLDVLCRAVEEGLPADSIKEVLRMLSHVITLCERESNSVPVKLADEHPLHLYVPALRSETVSGLASLFLRTDMFVSNEHYVVHYCRLMDFLCLNKANWVSLIGCVPVIGAALMTTVSADMRTMLETARQHISLESKVTSLAEPPQSPTKLTSSSSSLAASSPSPVDITSEGAVEDAVKPPRPTILFHQPNAELRLVHFLDLLQSTTKAMNHSGVIPKKSLPKTTAEERPALNGTPEDLKLLNDSLIHLQESVAWEHLVEVLRLLNHLIEEKPSPETAVQVVKHKISGYGTIAAEHQRMFPLIESLFQAATLPTVLFDHVASAAYSVAQNVVVLDKVGADGTKVPSTVTKTPMLLRDVSLSGTKLSKHKDANAKNALKLGDCYVTHKLFTLVEENKKLLNTKLNQNIRLLELSLQALRTVPELSKFLDFSVKRKYLRLQIKRLRRPMKWRDMTPEQRVAENVDESDDEGEEGGMEDEEADNVSVNVDRDDVLNQSFHCVQNYTPRQLMRGTFHITFNNEPGMDAGGLTREWLLILTRSIFKPAYALFSLSGDGVTYQPNPHSGANPEHLDYFKFIGRLVAKAIVDNVLLDVHFTRSFYKHILRVPISFSDLEAFDKDYFKNLNTLLQHPIDDLGVELTFTATANVFGTEVCSSLVEDGENVPVTDENKTEYVRLIAHHCLTTSFQKQIDAFLAGFHELLPHHLFSHFDPSELELLISGLPEIDIEDLVAHTTYTGYKQSDPVIQRFWAVLRKFSSEEKALFVQFVTGTSKVPLDGFQSLQGSEGVQMFSVHKAYNPGLLPTAHTCFNQLDLPEYASEEVMREKLVLAIRECSEGFGFQ